MFHDDVWIADSTPAEYGRSRETAKRSELAGFTGYGYCASHSRYFWGLRLHLLCTLHGLPIAAAVTGAKADERQILPGMLDDPDLTDHIAGTTLIARRHHDQEDRRRAAPIPHPIEALLGSASRITPRQAPAPAVGPPL